MVGSLCGGGETFDKMNGNAAIILGSNDESIVCFWGVEMPDSRLSDGLLRGKRAKPLVRENQ